MHKNLVGQTSSQKRNCKEQQKRRSAIKEKFPKTITFYTYEHIDQEIEKRAAKICTAFVKLGVKMRKSELKSLAITYYIDTYNNEDKKDLLTFIYKNLLKDNISIEDLISNLNNKYRYKEAWNRKRIINFLLLKR